MNFLFTFSRNLKLSRIKCPKNQSLRRSLRESVQIRSFFCPIFSRIRTDYGEIIDLAPLTEPLFTLHFHFETFLIDCL